MALLVLDRSGHSSGYTPTENARFKAAYGETLRRATLVATVLMALVFWLSPEVQIQEYRLPEEATVIVEIAPSTVAEATVPNLDKPREPMPPEEAIDDFEPFETELAPVSPPWTGPTAGPGLPPRPTPTNRVPEVFQVPPVLVGHLAPPYPELARELGLQGLVELDVFVGTDGRVERVVVRRTSHPVLEKVAIETAQRARFTPARQGRTNVGVWVTLPFEFRLYR